MSEASVGQDRCGLLSASNRVLPAPSSYAMLPYVIPSCRIKPVQTSGTQRPEMAMMTATELFKKSSDALAITGPAEWRSVRAPSDPVQILDERYGDSWRHEVVERRRDGEDMVVSCRLTIAAHGIDLTRSGRARIGRKSARSEIIGSADGIPFSFRSEDASGADGAADDAVERAVADALAKCVTAI